MTCNISQPKNGFKMVRFVSHLNFVDTWIDELILSIQVNVSMVVRRICVKQAAVRHGYNSLLLLRDDLSDDNFKTLLFSNSWFDYS